MRLPGFGLSLGFAVAYLGLLVLIPLGGLLLHSAELGPAGLYHALASARVAAAFRLTFGASLAAAVINAGFGLVVAWVLVRYRFPGRRLVDALVDLPFALPTAVSGIALTTVFAPTGWLGAPLARFGIRVAFTPLGITLALVLIGLPFVVRTVQPALADLEPELEEAAATLGAGRWTTVRRVVLPAVRPALAAGFAMAFARGIGEYGSVIFIAGNLPLKTEIVPLLIVARLEQYDYLGAMALGTAMLVVSFVLLLCVNLLLRGPAREAAR